MGVNMSKKTILCGLLATLIGINIAMADTVKPVTIGIVEPVQIDAMTQITNGFKDTLNKLYPGKITYIVLNAQADSNLERSMFLQLKAKRVDLVAPIGTMATQMAMSINQAQPIIGLAAEIKSTDRAKAKNKNVTNVLDDVSVSKQLAFIHAALPNLKQITLIYSTDDSIFPQAQEAVTVGKKYDIKVQKLMMQQISDLYILSKHIDKNSQAVFILKDAKVIDGINTILQQAKKRNIPVITSDDGSVASGAAFAIGVSETQIGIDGAHLAAQVLNGTPAKDVPTKVMDQYSLFLNPTAATAQHVDVAALEQTAKTFGYPVVIEK